MWVLTKIIFFGTFIDMIQRSKEIVRATICSIYEIKTGDTIADEKLLLGSLQWMRIVRNACAHNERIYCLKAKGRIIGKEIKKLRPSYRRDRDKKIFDLLIYLRYYMQEKEYYDLVNKIKSMLVSLQKKVSSFAFDNIRANLGIKNIDDLDILMADGFDNNYIIIDSKLPVDN